MSPEMEHLSKAQHICLLLSPQGVVMNVEVKARKRPACKHPTGCSFTYLTTVGMYSVFRNSAVEGKRANERAPIPGYIVLELRLALVIIRVQPC
jgi:hypothetical protein